MRSGFALCIAAASMVLTVSISSCSSWTESDLAPSPLDAAPTTPCKPDASADAAGRPVCFKTDIQPLINRGNTDPTGHGCKVCHFPGFWGDKGTQSIGLDLTNLGTLRQGGIHTETDIVVPGNPKASAIVQKLRGEFPIGSQMPKDGPPYWSEAQIELMERWISEGAQGANNE